jgi:hypothetical protein
MMMSISRVGGAVANKVNVNFQPFDDGVSVCSKAILGGLHHEYSMARA